MVVRFISYVYCASLFAVMQKFLGNKQAINMVVRFISSVYCASLFAVMQKFLGNKQAM